MGKIKLNLTSGGVVEKPLVNAFKANNTSYVVLDNEMNGSMGLPIILVCKLDNNKLTKIVDPNEWQIVKEYLKNIIAGGQIEFISVNNELPADDIYYTQLTLPVPSFDILKNVYHVNSNDTNTVGILDVNPSLGAQPSPASSLDSTINAANPVVENGTPIQNVIPPQNVETPVSNPTPVVSNPASPIIDTPNDVFNNPVYSSASTTTNPTPITPVTPVSPQIEVSPAPAAPEAPTTPPVSEVQPSSPVTPSVSNDIFKEQKEAFMQACENMFDALVQRFEKELENRK